MQYLLVLHVNESGWGQMTPEQQEQGMAAYMAYGEALRKAGAFVGSNRLKPSANCDHRARHQRQDAGAGRPLRGHQGAGRRLLPDRSSRSRRRDLLGRALPGRESWRRRSASGLADAVSATLVSFPEGDEARRTADAVARRSYGKLVAFLAARTRDVAAAEDALAEAFASALVDWPANGCPRNPEGWLLTVARRKLIDSVRRRQTGEAASTQLQILAEGLEDAAAQAERDMQIPDKRLALLFACAHPAIEAGIRAPLMLQVVLGLDGETIASAFLVSPAAMRKRLSRAKEKIQQAGIPFSIPEREELPQRLDAVLDAIYAGFAEGWTDPSGTDAIRRDLTDEAIFLARLVVELLPQEAEGARPARVDASCRSATTGAAQRGWRVRAARRAGSGAVELADDRRGRELCCGARARWKRSAAINSKPRCSRRMSIAAAPVTTTGRKWCSSTMRSSRSPARPSSRSIARWRLRSCMERKLRPRR